LTTQAAGFAIRHRCADANVSVEVRLLPLQPKNPLPINRKGIF
jgi:hypothetical protein